MTIEKKRKVRAYYLPTKNTGTNTPAGTGIVLQNAPNIN